MTGTPYSPLKPATRKALPQTEDTVLVAFSCSFLPWYQAVRGSSTLPALPIIDRVLGWWLERNKVFTINFVNIFSEAAT